MLSQVKPHVRSIDIATELEFSKPSVSVAMKNLRENGYILVDPSGYITLSESGREIAETMYERHTLLSNWLMYLGVDRKTAVEDACRMEHILSASTFEAIKQHIMTGTVSYTHLDVYKRQRHGKNRPGGHSKPNLCRNLQFPHLPSPQYETRPS